MAENIVPGKIRDQRTLDFQLKPQMVVPTEQLRARAEELRHGVHAAAAAPLGGGVPGPATVAPPFSPPTGAEVIQTPAGIGGQPVRPLPGGR